MLYLFTSSVHPTSVYFLYSTDNEAIGPWQLLVRLQRAPAYREQFLLHLFTRCKPEPDAPTCSGNANCSRTLLRLQVQHIIAFSCMYNNGQKILLITPMIHHFLLFRLCNVFILHVLSLAYVLISQQISIESQYTLI